MESRRALEGAVLSIAAAIMLGVGSDAGNAPGEALQLPCHSRADCGSPVKGGLRITFTGWACTTGFVARNAETRKVYVLTAGHCVVGSGLSALWFHHETAIGRASLEAFDNGSRADIGALEIDASDASNQVFGSNNSDLLSVADWVPDASQTVGSGVCRSGGTSGWRCGSIVTADVDATIDGRLIQHTWWTDFPSADGDSGSPLINVDGRAIGILIATTSTQSVYSTIDGVAAELNVRPCTDPGCS